MSLQSAPFLGIATTVILPAGGTTATTTFTTSTLGYPSCRITNGGGATAFVQFITTSNTTTVGVTNAQPVLSNQTAILATGGNTALAYVAAATTTIFITAGQGGTGQ